MVVGEFSQEADLVIIGGGPAGYSAAFRAAELGMETVIVDQREALGGVCLHEGCVPSKTLLHMAERINIAGHAKEFGIHFDPPKIDIKTIQSWNDNAIQSLSRGLDQLCKKHGVERLSGRASFADSRNLAIAECDVPRVRFRKAIICTGSRHAPHPAFDENISGVMMPNQAVRPQSIPETLLIIGNNYQALEIACIYHALGSEVTLIDEHDRFLIDADVDLARPLLRVMTEQLRGMHSSVNIESAEQNNKQIAVSFTGNNAPKRTTFDAVVLATPQVANVDALNLHSTKIQCDERGFIQVDGQFKTSDARIHAVGDVIGEPLLADKAIHQGRACAEFLSGFGGEFDARAVPMAVFTDPNIAWCGLTEAQAKKQSRDFAVKKIPWGASGRAVGMGRANGLTKIIYDASSELILGVGIVGAHAAEMIGEAALAIEMGAVLTDIAETIHPHPTTSELLSEVAHQASEISENQTT